MNRLLTVVCFVLTAWAARAQKTHSVFLLGDAGAPRAGGDPVLLTLQRQVHTAGPNDVLIFLGDNAYQHGIPDSTDAEYPEARRRLADQLAIARNFPGKVLVIAGNHDWRQGRRRGWEYVKNQAKLVAELTGREDVFVPAGGCPGPVEVRVGPDLTLLLMDTQYWLHPWEKPGVDASGHEAAEDLTQTPGESAQSDCENTDLPGFLTAVDDALRRNRDRRVLVVGHHPLYSHGEHGGYFPLRTHLFPIPGKVGRYVPLPVLGSVYAFCRSLFGNVQDIPHPRYRAWRNALVELLRRNPNALYTNGHDHNLQLIRENGLYDLTSGSGSKQNPVAKRANSVFAESIKGFARLDFYGARNPRALFFAPDSAQATGKLLFDDSLSVNASVPETESLQSKIENQESKIIASRQYRASPFKRWLLGNNYRDVWAAPVRVPTVDFRRDRGGLRVLQRGGGMQTLSLRLEGGDGQQYVLRSVEKFAENAIPPTLRSGFVKNLVQDQISASHPYAALVVPRLAEAAGVPHTNPTLAVIPADTALGMYQRLFAGTLSLFEERPEEGFGGAKKTFSTLKMLDRLADDHSHRVDQQAVLRARLFDNLVGDWDRHDDQWRWAAYPGRGKALVFRPIPRDRDQAFFVNEGFLPKIVSRKWLLPKVQGFDYAIRDVPGFNFNARHFDRSFLTALSKTDWLRMADTLRRRVTDGVIDEAVQNRPASPDSAALARHAAIIAAKLKRRRDDLPVYAEKLYGFLARTVDVVGSNQRERFDVLRQPDGATRVTVHEWKKNGGGNLLYDRLFDPAETREIRLYGLGSDDEFRVGGTARRAPLLRIVGGKGEDEIRDSSRVAGWRKKTLVYDLAKNTALTGGPETRSRLGTDPAVNEYDRKSFRYGLVMPQLSVQYNPDDGVFLGGGVLWRKQGFRREPFASQQRLVGNYAFATGAFNFDYQGDFTRLVGGLDVQVNTEIRSPNFVRNFFGLGNETVFEKPRRINFYRTRFEEWTVNGLLRYRLGKAAFFAGPEATQIELEENSDKFINAYLASVGPAEAARLLKTKWYGGLRAGFNLDTRDNRLLPTRGLRLNAAYLNYHGFGEGTRGLSRLESDLSFYASVRLPARLTFAARVGGGHNFGDFEFFQANTLGGLSNLRGFRRTRFAGRSSLYNNTEVRLRLFTLKTYLFPAYVGLTAFHDVGRVWQDGEASRRWHRGYGGGVWLAPYQAAIVSLLYTASDEERLPLVKVGFLF